MPTAVADLIARLKQEDPTKLIFRGDIVFLEGEHLRITPDGIGSSKEMQAKRTARLASLSLRKE
jgi:hypothetical protein